MNPSDQLNTKLRITAKKLEDAIDLRPVDKAGSRTRFSANEFHRRFDGPILVYLSKQAAGDLAALLRELARGKSLPEIAGLPKRTRGRQPNDRMLVLTAKLLRLQALGHTKQQARKILVDRSPNEKIPAVQIFTRWLAAQRSKNAGIDITLKDLAEGRTYLRMKDGSISITRKRRKIDSVLKKGKNGAKRGRF